MRDSVSITNHSAYAVAHLISIYGTQCSAHHHADDRANGCANRRTDDNALHLADHGTDNRSDNRADHCTNQCADHCADSCAKRFAHYCPNRRSICFAEHHTNC
eukprot:gene5155-biopygen4096